MKKKKHISPKAKKITARPNDGTRPFDPNIPYPMGDFLEDMEAIMESLHGNVVTFVRPLEIVDDETRENETLGVSFRTEFLRTQEHFKRKYSNWNVRTGRLMKYFGIMKFTAAYEERLLKENLIDFVQGDMHIENSFLEYLLNAKADYDAAEISKQIIDDFLQGKEQKRLRLVESHEADNNMLADDA